MYLTREKRTTMKTIIRRITLLLQLIVFFSISAFAEEPVFPVNVSDNGRYFVDKNDNPVFWLGTTQWQIFREYTLEEASITLKNIKNNGFILFNGF